MHCLNIVLYALFIIAVIVGTIALMFLTGYL